MVKVKNIENAKIELVKNEITILKSRTGKCLFCEQPSRMMCSEQSMQESIYNSFNKLIKKSFIFTIICRIVFSGDII